MKWSCRKKENGRVMKNVGRYEEFLGSPSSNIDEPVLNATGVSRHLATRLNDDFGVIQATNTSLSSVTVAKLAWSSADQQQYKSCGYAGDEVWPDLASRQGSSISAASIAAAYLRLLQLPL
ncbi:unnamed protein product, partial [Protopolystoma xenopodis]